MDVVMPSYQRKVQCTADKAKVQAMKRRRAAESEEDTFLREEKDKVRNTL